MSDSKTDFVNFVNQMAAENDTESFLRMTENPDARDFGPASTKKLFANAPFESIEEMLSISGISESMLEAAIEALQNVLLDKKSAGPGEKPEESNPQDPKESTPKKPEGNRVITKEKKPKKKNYAEEIFEVDGKKYVTREYKNLNKMMAALKPGGSRVMIWINAFIPRKTTGSKNAPLGQGTMIPGPPLISNWFLTDNRDFSNNIGVSVRMQSTFYGAINNNTLLWFQKHRGGQAHEIDPVTGATIELGMASTNNMNCEVIFFNGICFEVAIVGAASNPLVPASPDIDYNVTYSVFPGTGAPNSGYVWCKGKVDEYPNFESYVARNFTGPAGKIICQKSHAKGATPWDLLGKADQPVKNGVTF